MKSYKYIFWFLFDVCITNSYVLSCYTPTNTLAMSQSTLKSFRLQLALQLIGSYQTRKRPGRPRCNIPISLTSLDHMPTHGDMSRRCDYCKRKRVPGRRPRESIWICAACPDQPSLCLTGLDVWFELLQTMAHSICRRLTHIIIHHLSPFLYHNM